MGTDYTNTVSILKCCVYSCVKVSIDGEEATPKEKVCLSCGHSYSVLRLLTCSWRWGSEVKCISMLWNVIMAMV